jgi:hypothetical protein
MGAVKMERTRPVSLTKIALAASEEKPVAVSQRELQR